jgi:hypothetical protein
MPFTQQSHGQLIKDPPQKAKDPKQEFRNSFMIILYGIGRRGLMLEMWWASS